MRLLAIATLLLVLAGGLGAAFIACRQFETKTQVLAAPAVLSPRADGASCGETTVSVPSRTLGIWMLSVQGDQQLDGIVRVEGEEGLDIGLRVYDSNNNLILNERERGHEIEFQIDAELRGDYRFEIDNRHSVFASKTVAIDVCLS